MLIIPEEGFNHPDFQELKNNEALDLFFKFDYSLQNEIKELVKQVIEFWFSEVKTALSDSDTTPLFAYKIEPESARLVIAFVQKPSIFIKNLEYRFHESPLELVETFIRKRKFKINHQQTIKLVSNVPDSRWKKQKKNRLYFEFYDDKLLSKKSKQRIKYKRLMKSSYHESVTFPIYLNHVAINFGLKKTKLISNNPYADWLAEILQLQLRELFDSKLQLHLVHPASLRKVVQMIRRKKRVGYQFTIYHFEFYSSYGKWYRYRDYELLQVLRAFISTFHLAPVIHWERDQEKYRIQLWENWTD